MLIQQISNRSRRRWYILIYCTFVGLIAALSWISWLTIRQARLDSSLIAAIKTSNAKTVQELLNAGADANAIERDQVDISSWYSLFGRIFLNRNKTKGLTALLLIIHGNNALDISIRSYIDCDRVSEMLPESNTCRIIKALLAKGADVRAQDSYGRTPLVMLLQGPPHQVGLNFPDYQACRALIMAGSDVNASGQDGRTVLMLAEHWNYTDLVGLLVEKGADTNARDSFGYSPLCYCRTVDMAKILIGHGAIVNENNRYPSPIRIAIKNKNRALSQYLVFHGSALH